MSEGCRTGWKMHTFALYHHIFGLTQPYAIIKARSINTAWFHPELQVLRGILFYFINIFFYSSASPLVDGKPKQVAGVLDRFLYGCRQQEKKQC